MNDFEEKLAAGERMEREWFWPRLYAIHAHKTGMPEAILRTDVTPNQHTQGDHAVQIGTRMAYVDVKTILTRYRTRAFVVEAHSSPHPDPRDMTGDIRVGWGHPDHKLQAQWIAYAIPGASDHPDLIGHRIVLVSLSAVRKQGYVTDGAIRFAKAAPNKGYYTHNKVIPWGRFIADLDTYHYFANHVCRRVFAIRADDTTF